MRLGMQSDSLPSEGLSLDYDGQPQDTHRASIEMKMSNLSWDQLPTVQVETQSPTEYRNAGAIVTL